MRTQLRELLRDHLKELLAEPEIARALWRPVSGTVFPFVGGTSGTQDRIAKFNSAGNDVVNTVAPVYEDGSGNVGIGTTNPSGESASPKFVVKDSDATGTTAAISATNSTGTVMLFSKLNAGAYNNLVQAGDQGIIFFGSSSNSENLVIGPWSGSGYPGIRMTIAGNVGIGTSSPSDKLHVSEGRIRSEATGDIRNLVLNQLASSFRRTGIGFNWQGTEQYLLGADLLGDDEHRNFFLYDSVAGRPIMLILSPRGGTSDDAAQIQAAIDGLPSNGGIIHLAPSEYRINTKVTIAKNGVKLRGYGAADPGNSTLNGTPLTKLLWTGSADGTVVELKSGTSNMQIQDVELSDLSIDGATSNSAGIGLLLDRVLNSKFMNVRVRNCTGSPGTGIKLTTTATGSSGDNVGTSWNHFENCSVIDCVTGLHLTSETTGSPAAAANTCHNTFVSLNIQGGSVVTGIKLESCDNNSFYRTLTPGTNTTSPPPEKIGVLITDPDNAWANYFYHLQAGGHDYGLKVENADGEPASKKFIFGYSLDNDEHPPRAFEGGTEKTATTYVCWVDSNGDMHARNYLTT